MSIRREPFIWCDECGNWEHFAAGTKRVVRLGARKLGWSRKNLRDLCPGCTALESAVKGKKP